VARNRAITSRCSDFRTSTIEKNASTCGPWATSSSNCSKVREDSVAGITGTSRASAASNTLSDTREMLGGQSRKMNSYSARSGSSTLASLRVGRLNVSSARSMCR
jgi:hypothetical protein